ncbi:MAG: response regulator [Elusimicrobiales bacterium]|nr:response regulator [Elusimicrobiales bacterium]
MDNSLSASNGKTVLIVEDDIGVMEFLKIIVQREGFKVENAYDGHEGVEKARSVLPDLILLDLMLPKSGGFEIVRELQNEETGGIPVVIMTGRVMDRSTSEMIKRETNVREYLEKPIKTEVLAALMHRLLKTRPPARKPGPTR